MSEPSGDDPPAAPGRSNEEMGGRAGGVRGVCGGVDCPEAVEVVVEEDDDGLDDVRVGAGDAVTAAEAPIEEAEEGTGREIGTCSGCGEGVAV